MNEDQYKAILKVTDKDAGSPKNARAAKLSIQADIARQLTRIADQGEIRHEIKEAVTEVRSNLDDALANATPPDALVEAVGKFIDENVLTEAALAVSKGAGKNAIDVLITQVEKLKAAHKKAVT